MGNNGVNEVRRKIMRSLTGGVGKSRVDTVAGINKPVRRVFIARPNHRLGNLLLITPLIQEIEATFPDCKIDLFVKGGLAPILFENYPSVDRIISLPKKPFKQLFKYIGVWVSLKKYRYDLAINLDKGSSSGRLSTRFVSAKNKIFGEHLDELINKYPDYRHMAKNPVYNLRYYLNLMGYKVNGGAVATLNLRLTPDEIAHGNELMNELVPAERKTISVFTYATGSKCYSEEWWASFFSKLTAAFPGYNFLEVLPVENISKINFKAPSFYRKDVREIASVIANTEVFIAADSGIMHLGVASQTPTVGLFSVTRPDKYEPYGNGSLPVNTNDLDAEAIIAILQGILQTGNIENIGYA